MSEELRDVYGIPKAYTMVEGLEHVAESYELEEPLYGDVDEDSLSYFTVTGTVREELTMYLSTDDAIHVQDLLLEKEFEKVYEFLDEHWEESVREMVPDERIKGWEPDTPS